MFLTGGLTIPHLGLIEYGRLGLDSGQQVVAALILEEVAHFTGWVIEITENDGMGRASLRTSSLDLTVFRTTTGFFGFEAAILDALYAHRALLHHPAGTNGHIGIKNHLAKVIGHVVRKLLVVAVLEPVVSTNLVRAVVGAIPRTYTTVIRHHIQSV